MKRNNYVPLILLAFLCSILLVHPSPTQAYEARQRPRFPVVLSGARILFSPPTLADLDLDGQLDIVVGGVDGVVYAVRHDGSLRWSYDISPVINRAAQNISGLKHSTKPVPIRSSPAVADVTGDGIPEVIVTGGDVFSNPTHGGIVVLNRDGKLLPGWPKISRDLGGVDNAGTNGQPDGYADGIATSPSVGDIDGDGRVEIVYGAFDQHVYARHSDGTLLPNWPQFVLDTVWSSPALADLNGDGRLDVIIGVDSHYYRGIERYTEDGGDLYAFNGNGSILWIKHQDEIIESSAAVADVNDDGRPEIFIGTGEYRSISEGKPYGRYFTAYNHDGSIRWRQNLPKQVIGSPAIGDINGDGRLEVVVGVVNGEVYAFDGSSGAVLWHTLARDIFNNQYLPDPEVTSPMLGDYDGDGVDDVFIALAWDVVVMRGKTGTQLTATSNLDPARPSFYASYGITPPAIGDIDGNGKLDVISASGNGPSNNPGKAQINAWSCRIAH